MVRTLFKLGLGHLPYLNEKPKNWEYPTGIVEFIKNKINVVLNSNTMLIGLRLVLVFLSFSMCNVENRTKSALGSLQIKKNIENLLETDYKGVFTNIIIYKAVPSPGRLC